ncbi:MAG: methionine/alanine import family NSS transporter small subunit [Acinetobacter sp.]|nr:MAG: methionine/alanine import family NSS transporter small subunit [Acinetobacter sp.]
MNHSAIVMMVMSMILLWGGLIWSIVHLIKNPELED